IMSRDQGYRLNPHITVRRSLAVAEAAMAQTVMSAAATAGEDDDGLNERQLWVLAELDRGSEVRRNDVEARFKCSTKTAKRDLVELREAGRIEWVEYPRPGHYRLAAAVSVA
ncbi:MAG: hypothetical protein WCI73_17155, partial [Phycisphaerae bacterium]